MAIYRNVSIDFWKDPKVIDEFTPEDRYFMLYFLTNGDTNLAGCYEVSIKKMANDLGYDEEKVKDLINSAVEHNVISYSPENKELLIKNWYKYNWTKSSKLDLPLKTAILEIKTPEFRNYLAQIYNSRDTVSIRYRYGIHTVYIPYGYNCYCYCY